MIFGGPVWSQHAMLTNLVSSAAFTVVTVTVMEAVGAPPAGAAHRRRAAGGAAALTVVRSAAYNAVARAPIAQRRIMWFLVHGGELRRLPEFEISETHAGRLRAVLARHGLAEVSEDDVMRGGVPRPGLVDRFSTIGPGSGVTPGRARRPAGCVALEEALIDKGGERSTTGGHFRTPGRRLLPPDDLAALEERDPAATSSLRLHPEDPPRITRPDLTNYPVDHPGFRRFIPG